ncbi:choice-of-anchor K domain-containing protein [Nocardia sp. NBC_00508]|uniref:choice-of-anchor K domain-containing protein n=1 Tax=Nocardia sp. NBC_00508 TaxID=2975992 RepID=UPI002E823568|nr:choice-of-anchor K domain-containing protein [Nocardia sp. NBC_00508]WUD66066.1 choice-of-anchor K domain-containing protein [Nocardia sp. NBC_00508]
MGKVSTKGEWARVSVEESQFEGLRKSGTRSSSGIRSSIRWGGAQDDEKSGYDFTGLTDVDALLDGKDFKLGIFTHYNRRTHLKHSQFWVYLEVTVDFQDEGFDHTFTLRFRHDETPNQPGDVPDAVKLPIVHENDIVRVDDVEYKVSITGFLDGKGQVTPQFDNPEDGIKRVWLVARFEPMSEPGS